MTHTGKKLVENLIQEIENAMKEKTEALNHFDAFNTKSKADHAKNISELAKCYGQPKQDILKGNKNEVFPIVDEQQCVREIDNFVKDATLTLETERLKKDALTEKKEIRCCHLHIQSKHVNTGCAIAVCQSNIFLLWRAILNALHAMLKGELYYS